MTMTRQDAVVNGSTKALRRRSGHDRDTAARLAETEYARCVEAFATLTPEDWAKPTACVGWDVRALVAHVVGMTEMWGSTREQLSQMRRAGKAGGLFIDALTALQVADRADATPEELIARMQAASGRAARRRRRFTRLIGGRLIRPIQDLGAVPGQEWWAFDYATATILTRDPWLHRSDLAEATGRPMHVTAEHDGVLVADVVAEWAQRHGRPYQLRLTGPAGGEWRNGDGGEHIELDAIEFCRRISGRGFGPGLLSTFVPF